MIGTGLRRCTNRGIRGSQAGATDRIRALPVRAVLYTVTHHSIALIAIQILDGVGAGIFGVVSVLVIADLTQGTGRFNLTLGATLAAFAILYFLMPETRHRQFLEANP